MIEVLLQISTLPLLVSDLAVRHQTLEAAAWRGINDALFQLGKLSDRESSLLQLAIMSSQCSAIYELSEGQAFSLGLAVPAASQSFVAYSIMFAVGIRDGSLGRHMPSFKVAEKVRILRSFSEDKNALTDLSIRFGKCEIILDGNQKMLNEEALQNALKSKD